MTIETDHRYIKAQYNSEQAHLLSLGIQFYIAGRVTCLYCLIDSFLVAPLLFRHAIEYFLKGYLSFDHNMAELKSKYGHDLSKLWNRFKEIESDDGLEKFDEFISQFNETEFMRYPKSRENMKAGQKEAYEIDISLSFDDSITNIEPNAINWSINTVDELIYTLCKRMRSPISTIDWIEQRYRKNDALFSGNKHFKKSENNSPITIQLSAPPIIEKNDIEKT
jgi:hypothetical protein